MTYAMQSKKYKIKSIVKTAAKYLAVINVGDTIQWETTDYAIIANRQPRVNVYINGKQLGEVPFNTFGDWLKYKIALEEIEEINE